MSTLHITNGDSAADTLRTFLADPVVITADPLFDGPAAAVDDDEWYAMRGRQLGKDDAAATRIAGDLASWDRIVDDAVRRGDEIVLWFEHDLFDQLLLIRMLDRLRRHERLRHSVSLICIDRFPGVERFIGLGQLTAERLATLIDQQTAVTAGQFAHASKAWAAFRANDPTVLTEMVTPGPLPFLGAAVRRLLEEYPSTFNGLSRSATQVMRVLKDGPLEAGAVFVDSQQLEEHPFIGDWSLFDIVRRLASSKVPLVSIRPAPNQIDLRGHTIEATDAGQAVLAGRQDALTLNGIDEWRGGVHLEGRHSSPWRWDAARETLISLEA